MNIHNLKSLGLTLAAFLAIGALSASAASASSGKLTMASGTSVTLDGTENGLNATTVFGGKFECPGSTTVGHRINTTPHEPIPSGDSEETITPSFVNCFEDEGGTKHKTTVTMTSCDFTSKTEETTGGVANTYGISFGVSCSTAGDAIHVDIYSFASSELGGIVCSVTIPEQSGRTGAHVTNDTVNEDLTVEGTITGMTAKRSGSACSTEETNTGQIDIHSTIKGTNAGGGNVGISVSE